MSNFFEMCKVETSDFDENFERSDPEWNLIKRKYDGLKWSGDGTIPKIIHFMWIGSPLPAEYEENIYVWGNKNPKFEIKIWDDVSIHSFLKDKKLYSIFCDSDSMGIKSDVARYHILKEFGGLYLDTDFICLSGEFDKLHDNLSFYSCCSFERKLNVFNGMIASEPNHPIINLCIENCDPSRATGVRCVHTRVFYQTGPYLFTRCILHHLMNSKKENEVILPAQFFYPFPAVLREGATRETIEPFIKPHSMACHLWHASWQK